MYAQILINITRKDHKYATKILLIWSLREINNKSYTSFGFSKLRSTEKEQSKSISSGYEMNIKTASYG